ncbi:Putative DNA-binding domain-containing protein [Nonlabens sp. Hel1_33_55]|uniref:AlbA family DNA-binding domain-containing protein n=1 Tax=Nonlabens sp. Hel1_33_55 TaxID=1336802 RepID=UPI000875D18A|nr:ATP-binding protein [Nonlabens sp. Hel1_33_55]SCY07446.1 Putative DNA-binding domain-containing protein [Nonlabens sp. Hel1_33_55]
MLSNNEFEQLLAKSENSTLDFKTSLYDFSKGQIENAKFIKDVISFSNTIRKDTSYIIFGIKELQNGAIEFNGITQNIDDAILQDKVKDNIYPRPSFAYYTIKFEDKIFGVLEFPVTKFELPLSPTKKMKGLEAGKFYFRNGTSNTEATGLDAIRISKWLESIPGNNSITQLSEKISNYIIRLSDKNQKLSIIIPELLSLSKKFDLKNITEFCSSQIKGIDYEDNENNSYRKQKVFGSPLKADFNTNPYIKPTQSKVKSEMSENKEFYSVKIIFNQNLLELEDFLDKFSKSNGVSMTIQETKASDFLKVKKAFPFYIYCLEDDYIAVYNNIRQKTIDLLMDK